MQQLIQHYMRMPFSPLLVIAIERLVFQNSTT